MLKGKTVLLGVTGSIAAYKIAGLASMLKKAARGYYGADDAERHEFYQPHYI